MTYSKLPCNESGLQTAVAAYLAGLEEQGLLTFQHSVNEGKRPPWYTKKLTEHGMRKGQPDFDIYHKGGLVQFIELKTMTGTLGKAQKSRHRLLRDLGYQVDVIFADTPHEAIMALQEALTNGQGDA